MELIDCFRFEKSIIDYDVNEKATQRFFSKVQNKLHWAFEMVQLGRLVKAYLDIAESMALRHILFAYIQEIWQKSARHSIQESMLP